MACAILERTSGLEPSSETTAPRYLKLVSVPNFCPFTFIYLWMAYVRLIYIAFTLLLIFAGFNIFVFFASSKTSDQPAHVQSGLGFS